MRWYTLKVVAELLGVNRKTVWNWGNESRSSDMYLPNRAGEETHILYVNESDLIDFVERHRSRWPDVLVIS